MLQKSIIIVLFLFALFLSGDDSLMCATSQSVNTQFGEACGQDF